MPDPPRETSAPTRDVRMGNWETNQKPRPPHRPGELLLVLLLNILCWITAGGVIAMGILHWQTQEKQWLLIALGALALHMVFRIWRYTFSLRVRCPLCHGTPLHVKRCGKHRSANKFLFFGYRASTALSMLFRGRFNCMYCGTPYRLRK